MGILRQFQFDGKNVMVTGGGSGIGKCLCNTFAELGASVAVIDIDLDAAKQTCGELQNAFGIKCMAIGADVSSKDSVEEMAQQVVDEIGVPDVALCNVGIALHAPMEDMPLETFERVMDINLKGTFLTAQAAARLMIAHKKGGSIINTASMCGHIINRPQKSGPYCISKGGILQMTRSMASEWAKYGIRVNSVSPGYVYTNIIKDSPHFNTWEGLVPMGRLAEVQEIMGAFVYLASDAASYTTGTDLIVDGGYTCW